MKIPIICIHKGKHRYLYYILKQAKLFNEEIILLGDNISSSCKRIVQYYPLKQFATSRMLEQFNSLYFHLSSNSEEFEITCFERWFQILELMELHNIEYIVHIDSDNLIYQNLMKSVESNIGLYNAGYNIAIQDYNDFIWSASAHISFWKYSQLQDFCSFILQQYKSGKDELMKKWHWHKNNNSPGGINDMTLLYLYYLKNKDVIANLLSPANEGMCSDQNINNAHNLTKHEYRMRKANGSIWIKDIRFSNRIPYCFNEHKKKEIEFVNLHFQGQAKYLIYLFINWKLNFYERTLSFLQLWIASFKKKVKDIINK